MTRLGHRQIAEQRFQMDALEAEWLRKAGWKYVCDTPGSLWMWQQELNGRVYVVSQSTATRLQSAIEIDAESKRRLPAKSAAALGDKA